MTTNASMLLPNIAPPNRTATPKGTARASRPVRKDAEQSETTDRQPIGRSGVQKTDAGQREKSSDNCASTGERRSSFGDMLKKRLGKNNSDTEAPQKGNDKTENKMQETASDEAAVVFQAQPEPQAKPDKTQDVRRIFRSDVQTAEPKQKVDTTTGARIKPTDQTAPRQKAEPAAGKGITQAKVDTPSANGKTQSTEKGVAEAQNTSSLKSADGSPVRTEQTAETSPKTSIADTKPVFLSQSADSPIQKHTSPAESQAADISPRLVQFAAKNTPITPQNSDSEENPESSLKNNSPHTSKLNIDKQLVADSQSADTKTTEAVDVKERPTTSVQTVGTSGPVASASNVAPTSTVVSQLDPARGPGDIAAARPVDQIVQTLQLRTFGPESQVRMTLSPEELGAIRITFRQINSEVVGLLEVQKTDTRREIERSVGQLAAAMETAGVQVRRIEVIPWNNNPQSARGEQFSHDFDARNHQEMYRYSENESSQSKSKKGFTVGSETPQEGSDPRKTNDSGQSETGLNLFI